jgi:predicted naringenin-chalcone synthase
MRAAMERYGCAPAKLGKRKSALKDFYHDQFDQMTIFNVEKNFHGASFGERMQFYSEAVWKMMQKAYEKETEAPKNMIHVTCTGYESPSAVQKLIDLKGWQNQTTVTHAYHMGCYASFPALRIARGFLHTENGGGKDEGGQVDVVHSELCTLHLDPSKHSPEQLIVQSLFSDGFIKYSLSSGEPSGATLTGLEILSLQEAIVPDSSQDMTWVPSEWGMKMTLSRAVPLKLAQGILPFLTKLFETSGFDLATEKAKVIFAIHPGGPKIIESIQELLQLEEWQVAFSKKVFFERGNMSSATLPHVWKEILEEREVAPGTLIASLAFGPGLTACGGLFRKT